jgi:hypothetical protein
MPCTYDVVVSIKYSVSVDSTTHDEHGARAHAITLIMAKTGVSRDQILDTAVFKRPRMQDIVMERQR